MSNPVVQVADQFAVYVTKGVRQILLCTSPDLTSAIKEARGYAIQYRGKEVAVHDRSLSGKHQQPRSHILKVWAIVMGYGPWRTAYSKSWTVPSEQIRAAARMRFDGMVGKWLPVDDVKPFDIESCIREFSATLAALKGEQM